MNVINRKWGAYAAVALIALALLVAGGMIVHQMRKARGLQHLRDQGIAASSHGQHQQAVESLVLYLQASRDDRDALRAYIHSRPLAGLAGGAARATADTILALRYLASLEPENVDDQRQLLSLYLQSEDYPKAASAADAILARLPDDGEALSGKLTALLHQESWKEAMSVAGHWASVAPLDVEPQVQSLFLLNKTGDRAAARQRAIALLRAHPGDARFEYLRGVAVLLTGKGPEPAHPGIPAVAEDNRTTADWFLLAASHAPADLKFDRALVHQLDGCGLFDDSLKLMLKLSQDNALPGIRGELAARLWESENFQQVVVVLKDLDPSSADADCQTLAVAATSLTRVGDATAAARYYQRLASRDDDVTAPGWAAAVDYFLKPDVAGARKVLQASPQVLAAQPGSAIFHFVLAQACSQCGAEWQAAGEFENAALCSPGWSKACIFAAEIHLKRGEIDAALAACEAARRRGSGGAQFLDVPVAIETAQVWLNALDCGRTIDRDGLARLAAAIQKSQLGEPVSFYVQVRLLADAGKSEEAIALLRQFNEDPAPRNRALSLRLAALSQSRKLGFEKDLFDRLDRDSGPTPEVALARANLLLAAGDAAGGRAAINTAHQNSGNAKSSSWALAEAMYLDRAADASANAAWVALGDAYPDDAGVQQAALASRAAGLDRQFFDRTMARLKTITGEHGIACRLASAGQMLSGSTDRKAAGDSAALLESLIRDEPACAQAHRLLAICRQRTGDADAAMKQLLIAANLAPTDPGTVMELVQTLNERHAYADSVAHLQNLVDSPSATPEALAMMGWLREREGMNTRAEAYYRRALAMRPDFAVVQNNLAMLLTRETAPEAIQEAGSLANAITTEHPEVAEYWDTRAVAERLAGNPQGAVADYDRAISLAPNDLNLHFGRVRTLLSSGQHAEAVAAFAQLNAAMNRAPAASADLKKQLRDLQIQLGK